MLMEADLVLLNCNVLTMNPSQPHAEAVAIKEDKIVKVGTNEDINRLVGKDTRVVELNGETVLPGLIDTHVHIADFGRFVTWLDLKGVKSVEEVKKIIKKRVQTTTQGKWILGQGWNQTNFTENRMPNVHDLDEAAPDHPIVLYHQSGCMCAVNSKALELAGITKETTAPAGGSIEHDPQTGELTGVLGKNAMNLIWEHIPEPTEEEALAATSLACERVVEAGITSAHWIVSSVSEIQLIQRLRAENRLPLRVIIIFPADILDQMTDLLARKDFEDNRLRIGGVKVFADGFLAARTAALKEPYSDDHTTKGKLLYSQEELCALVATLHKANLHLIIHAMGDQAIDLVLTILEKNLKESPRENHRYRIEQASVLNRKLIQRMKKLKVIVGVQPCTIISEFSAWSAVDRLGQERARLLYPLKTLFKEGIRISGGSDCPMEQISPFAGIQAAVTRQVFPEEQVTVEEALCMYTVNAAYASFDENIKGSIEEGKLADLTVVSRDPHATPPNQIENIKVKMTIVGGKIVYLKSS
jgi:predicted amidohydrolase YtcJ